jgi:lysozyme
MDAEAMLRELTRDEDLRLTVYRCPAGRLTIGIGRNLEDRGITAEEARYLARNDIAAVAAELDQQLPWWRELDEVRQRVILNMAFNLGVDGLLPGGKKPGFPQTLELVRTGQYLEAAQAMLKTRWAKQVGARAQRLALMMRDGVVPSE